MAEWRLALLVLVLLVLNGVTSIKHSNYYRQTLKKMMQENTTGFLGVGMSTNKFKKRSIVLMRANPAGVIEECQVMSGLTIFSKFKRFAEIEGRTINGLSNEIVKRIDQEALKQAIDLIELEMAK